MLNKNYAESIMKVAQGNTAKPVIAPQTDWLNVLQQGVDDYYKYDKIRTDRANTQALTDALKGGNEEEIQKAYSVANPDAYMEYLNNIKVAREKAYTDFANKKELLGLANQYDTALQILKNQGKGADLTSASKNYEYLKSQGLDDSQAMAIAFGGNTEAVGGALASGSLGGKGINSYDVAMGKSLAEKESARQDFESLKPSAYNAIERAEKALESGAGLGPVSGRFGAVGLSTTKGGLNQADINAANSQMNAILRQKLASTGLTGSELNSAVEAQAYRYTISPDMPISQIKRMIQNFKDDYMSNGNTTPTPWGKQNNTRDVNYFKNKYGF